MNALVGSLLEDALSGATNVVLGGICKRQMAMGLFLLQNGKNLQVLVERIQLKKKKREASPCEPASPMLLP